MPSTLSYGSWPSPLTAKIVSAAAPRIDGARIVPTTGEIWWGQTVPHEGGRVSVKRREASGAVVDVLPAPWNARSSVHEYGGGAWAVTDAGALVFVEKSDQRVWLLTPGGDPRALTPAGMRFGGLRAQHGRLLAVREQPGVGRDIVEIPLDVGDPEDPARIRSLAAGSDNANFSDANFSDFVAQPALSPDGTRLAWVAWNHPDMPWDRAQVLCGTIAERGPVTDAVVVAGSESSALQPEWASEDTSADTSEDTLLFCDDRSGRWNLYRWHCGDEDTTAFSVADADTGGPLWVLGSRWFGQLGAGEVVAVRTHGSDQAVLIDQHGTSTALSIPATGNLVVEDARDGVVLISGTCADTSAGVWKVTAGGQARQVFGTAPVAEPEWIPTAESITVNGADGPVYAFAFPPTHPTAQGPESELPPYVLFVHGGPTAHTAGLATAKIAYLTSRGIGVVDVNYGGSTGYGRAYRDRLRGQWGVVDVADVIAVARHLIDTGTADPARVAIAGGSAGGWTVLSALAADPVFSAGISRYGVADARALAADTHDFESRYLDGLIGPLPEAEDVYLARSPLSHPERFTAPILLLQGAEDRVVPPAQSEAIRDALAARAVPHAYLLYPGEGHGFRSESTQINALETELGFLATVFGFTPDDVQPLTLQ